MIWAHELAQLPIPEAVPEWPAWGACQVLIPQYAESADFHGILPIPRLVFFYSWLENGLFLIRATKRGWLLEGYWPRQVPTRLCDPGWSYQELTNLSRHHTNCYGSTKTPIEDPVAYLKEKLPSIMALKIL